MVTKTLMNNKRLMADHNYSSEFLFEPNEDQQVPELEETKQIIIRQEAAESPDYKVKIVSD